VKGVERAVEVQRVAKSMDQMQLEEEEEKEEEEGCHDWARTGPVLVEIRAEIASFQEMLSKTLEGFVRAPPLELDI
jgi:hypothetical protein